MSSDKHCCVPGCKDSGGMHYVLHGFPKPDKDIDRFNIWLDAIGGQILSLDKNHISKYRRVCHAHFEQKYQCRNNRISNIAVPTLNMPAHSIEARAALSDQNPALQIQSSDVQIPSTSIHNTTAPVKVTRAALAEINSMLQTSDVLMPSTSSDTSFRHSTKCRSTLIIDKNQGKENISPAENIPKSETDVVGSSLDHLTINEVTETGKQGREAKKSMQPSNTKTKLYAQKKAKGKSAKKTIRRLYMTNAEKELLEKLTAARVKLSKCRNKLKKQSIEINAAKKVASHPILNKVLENSTSTAKLLIQMEIRENKKKGKGRRFSLKEKIATLSILKQSPKAYKNLRKIFTLPAPQTLHKLIQNCNLGPGINKNIFAQIKKKSQDMTEEEKICVLLFDEISLQANLAYQERKDHTTGFVDNGEERLLEFADHAQVFMVRGLVKNFKQPVYYTFAASATKGPELAKQIKTVISELQKAGLTIVATICDQGTNNRSAVNILLNQTKGAWLREGKEPINNIIIINGQEIVPLYDPPHLLKGLRNNLLTKNLKYEKDGETKVAKWEHLQLLYKENPGYKGVRLMPKLTENHIYADKINKMKVKYATQIFSRTVASNMGYLADKGILPSECRDTADLLLFMDNLFDSVNGSFDKKKKAHAKPLLGPATPSSAHDKTWVESIRTLKRMKFINASGKEESVPSLKNWVWTLEGMRDLLKILEKKFKVTSVWMRHLNQDPLENFFGSIRSHGCRNNNPSCYQFQSAFTTLLINNLKSVHSRGKNCEEDFCKSLQALVIEDNTEPSSTSESYDFENLLLFNFTPLDEKTKDPRIIAPLQYMSGYFAKQIKTNVFKGCKDCNADILSNDELQYIKYREYAGRRWLITPSNEMIYLISQMQDLINEIIKENLKTINLKIIVKTAVLTLIDFDFIKCQKHKNKLIDYLINIVFRCFIFNYCKNINQILTGKRDVDDETDKFQLKAKKYYKKCFKRKK